MRVQTGIPRSSSQALAVFVWDVLARLCVTVALGEAEVDDVDVVLSLPLSDQEVVWLHVSMEVEAGVDVLDSLNHLICQHEHRFEGELPATFPEEFLYARP